MRPARLQADGRVDRPADPLHHATARDEVIAGAVADAVITSMHEGGRVVKVEAL